MNWDAFGAIAEGFGALAVIATLGYVALQLRQNTKAVRASTYEAHSNLNASIQDTLIEHAEVLGKLERDEDLTAAEYILTRALAAKVLGIFETTFLHHQEGVISDEVFEARMEGLRALMANDPFLQNVWSEVREAGYVRGFAEFVDEIHSGT